MVSDERVQIVAVLPDGQFFGLGLLELGDIDILIALLATRDARSGHGVSPIDVRRAYDQAKASQTALEVNRQARGLNNDADADGA